MTSYENISSKVFELSGVCMNKGEFMDAEKRKIVFTTLHVMATERKILGSYIKDNDDVLKSVLIESIIKKLSKDKKFHNGHAYYLWRKSKMSRWGNLEEFIDFIFEITLEDKDYIEKILK